MTSKRYQFEVWQNGMCVATGSGTDIEAVQREALHYAFTYAQDGPVTVKSSRGYEKLFDPVSLQRIKDYIVLE